MHGGRSRARRTFTCTFFRARARARGAVHGNVHDGKCTMERARGVVHGLAHLRAASSSSFLSALAITSLAFPAASGFTEIEVIPNLTSFSANSGRFDGA